MRYLSVCSGIEAATVAWHPLGWEPVAFSEIDKFPSAILAHHYPHVPNYGDMTNFKEWPVDAVDLLVGGTPCQSFSVAGLRKGLDDPRGNLALTFLAIADRFRPKWIVWENVPGVLSSGKGRDFGSFLGGLGELGYGWSYRVLDAQYAGVPQRRRRVFVVGHLGDWRRAAAILFERHSLSGHSAPSRKARESVAALTANGVGTCGADDNQGQAGHLIARHIAPSLTSNYGKQPDNSDTALGPMLIAYGGGNTSGPINVATAQTAQTAQTAHGVRQDFDTETFVTHTLRAEGFDASEDGTGRGVPLVAAYDLRNGTGSSVSQTLNAGGMGDDRGACPNALPHIISSFSCKDHGADAGDTAPTLRAMAHAGSHANASGQIAVAFQSSQSGVRTGQSHATLDSNNGSRRLNGVVAGSSVRRLTPTECERLQGFPDDYTAISHRRKQAADGPRYKALGNSMAVPVMRWIGQRICMVEKLLEETHHQ